MSARVSFAKGLVTEWYPHADRVLPAGVMTEMPGILLETKHEPASLVEGAMDAASIVVFGQRPQSLSGRRRRGRPAVTEQASLFGFS